MLVITLWWFSSGQPSCGHCGGLLGDNPVYGHDERIISIKPRNCTANIQDTNQSSNKDENESPPDREFHNPIYSIRGTETVYSVPNLDTNIGMGSMPCHKFDDPIYDVITDETGYSMLSAANGAPTETANIYS